MLQLSWKRKLATVKDRKADVSSASPSSERKIKLQENERQRVSRGKFRNFCFLNSYSPPPPKKKKVVEFNLRPAQYCINKNIWPDQILYLGDFKMDVIK